MKKIMYCFLCLSLIEIIFCTSCVSTSNSLQNESDNSSITSSSPSNISGKSNSSKTKDLILDGELFSKEFIDTYGGYTIWYCTDYYSLLNKETLLEMGYFNGFKNDGFILFDGTNEGISVFYSREGLNHRWDWGKKEDGGMKYSIILEPNGTAFYCEFPEDVHTAKPKSLYKAYKR